MAETNPAQSIADDFGGGAGGDDFPSLPIHEVER